MDTNTNLPQSGTPFVTTQELIQEYGTATEFWQLVPLIVFEQVHRISH